MDDINKQEGTVDETSIIKPPLPPYWPTAYKYGVLAALFSIITTLVFDLLGFSNPESASTSQTVVVSLVGFAVMAVFIILAIQHQRDQLQEGAIDLGRGFMTGFGTTLITALITLFFTYIYFTFVQTGMQEVFEQQAIISMEDSGMSDADIQRTLNFASIFWSPPALAAFATIGVVIQGAIISIVTAAIMKR